MRGASELDAGWSEYMASSVASSAASLMLPAAGVSGVMRATTTAAARRGEMLVATSKGVVPGGTSRMEPSGSWTLIDAGIGLLINYKDRWLERGFIIEVEYRGGHSYGLVWL